MLSRHLNTILGLPNTEMKKSTTQYVSAAGQGKRLFLRFVLCSSLILGVLISISFFASTSASHRNASLMLNNMAGRSALGSSSLLVTETVETLATDCAMPKSTYVLGESVCAQVNGAPLPYFGYRQRRFQWVDPSGSVVQQTDITTDPQDDTFTVPTTGPLAQVGTWTVRTIKNNGSTVALTRFLVRDPANLRADLSVGKYGQLNVKSGNNTSYVISVVNRGPDDAQAVSFTDDVPANMTFVNATQNTGLAFTCSNPTSGGTGTSTCTIATLPRDETATFTFVYEVTAGTPVGTTIENIVSISSSTTELNAADNSSSALVSVTGVGNGGDDCVISCPAGVTVVAGANQSGAIVTFNDPTTTGSNCGSLSCSHASGGFFGIGTTTVVCAAETGNSCSFNITVQDNQNPTISCPANISTSEDPPASGSAAVSYPAPSASDNSGVVSVSCDHASGSSFPVGTTTVTCTATDESSNTASCSFTVTVTGNGCVLSCPSNITVDATAGSCGTVVNYPNPTGSIECGTVSSTPASGSTFPVGTTTVNVTSDAGQSCSFTVTVVDNQAPTITSCPGAITVNAPSGSCSAIVDPGTATAADNCSGVTVVGTRSDFVPIADHHYPVGSTTITWTATDGSGNSTSCEQIITVQDLIPPTVSINVPPAVATVIADANCQALIPDISEFVTATDNCTPASGLTITQSPVADTVVGKGSYIITITVIEGDPDGPHNTTTATTTFTVNDGTPPVITLNGANPIVVECHTSFTDPGATAHDTCAGDFPATVSGSVNVNVPGSYTLTYNASDPSGNAASPVTRTVNVVDTTPPVITSCAAPVTVSASSSCAANVAVPDMTGGVVATDSCASSGSLVKTQVPAAGTLVGLGTTPVTITVTDPAGLSSSCATSFTVIAPPLSAVGPTSIWLGLKNSDDVGTIFDLLAEAYKNGVLVGSGQVNSVPGGSSGFNNAVLRTINMAQSGAAGFCPGDVLSIKVSVRIATTGHRSGTARLWFHDSAANSRFSATVGGVNSTYYLRYGFLLDTTVGPGPKKTIDVFVDRLVGGNPFKPFGTWTKTF